MHVKVGQIGDRKSNLCMGTIILLYALYRDLCGERKRLAREQFMSEFEQFLVDRGLTALEVSLRACVRYMTVWNASKGRPISKENADKIREATFFLCGARYIGQIVVYPDPNLDQTPTLPLNSLTRKLE